MEYHLKNAKRIAWLLDNQFSIGSFRFGLDPLLGLFFGVGNMVTVLLSTYIVWIAWEMQTPAGILARMIFNIAVDFLIGLIPILGQLLDFGVKANQKNIELLENYLRSSSTKPKRI